MINLFMTYTSSLPQWVLASFGAVVCALTFFGLMAVAQRADARRVATRKNRNTLNNVARAYREYKSYEPAVMRLIRPALVHYGHLLGRREGGDFSNNLQWELDGDTVILIASEDCKDVWRLRLPTFYFDAPYDVLYVIEDMVWANQDQNDIRDEQVAILNAERMREDTGE